MGVKNAATQYTTLPFSFCYISGIWMTTVNGDISNSRRSPTGEQPVAQPYVPRLYCNTIFECRLGTCAFEVLVLGSCCWLASTPLTSTRFNLGARLSRDLTTRSTARESSK